MQKKSFAAPLKLLPLLLLYGLFVLWRSKQGMQWDEGRYFLNAQNLRKGYFASLDTLMFWNGPGYPLYLLPYVTLKLPLIFAKLGNAVCLYLAVVYFHAALGLLGIGRRRLFYAYALGVFLLLHGSLIEFLMTEALAVFLVSGAAYHFLRASASIATPDASPTSAGGTATSRAHTLAAGLHLGYLALTKVFFGYALVAGMVFASGWWALRSLSRAKGGATRPAAVAAAACALGLLLCLPYLAYTHAKTGKLFFWSNAGGAELYCMSLPESEFLGDWFNFEEVLFFPQFFKEESAYYRKLDQMDYITRDAEMKKAALLNIRRHPRKYLQNWRANVNRIVFGFPVTRYPGSDPELATGNRTFVYALPFFLCVFALWPAWRHRRALPASLWMCLAFAGIALGGLSLLSAIPRMVFPLLPILALWLAATAEAGNENAQGAVKR